MRDLYVLKTGAQIYWRAFLQLVLEVKAGDFRQEWELFSIFLNVLAPSWKCDLLAPTIFE